METYWIIAGVVAGLALFLLGMTLMAHGLKRVAGGRLNQIIVKFTRTPLLGVFTGFVACALLDSSSATIILVVTLVQARLMTFDQALGVVMGANIGTTVGSQIIAFDLEKYSPYVMGVGALVRLAWPSERGKRIGFTIFGFGMLFFGLGLMGSSVAPLARSPKWSDWLASLGEVPVWGAAAGCVFTLVIQSSSAAVGTAIELAREGVLPLKAGVAIMLGAEIGTVSDTLIATIGRSREAVRTAIFHLLFNSATVAAGLALINPLIWISENITPGAGEARYIANAHVLFNVIGVFSVVWFTPWIARGLKKLIPEKHGGKADFDPEEAKFVQQAKEVRNEAGD